MAFNHQLETHFRLEGQHQFVDCRQCHTTLEFSRAETNCASCHLDMHQQTVGDDCARCHDASSWLVNNIADIHREVSFPLTGAHAVANCTDCHKSETGLRFDPMGTDCISCHLDDYASTTNPNHQGAGFSTNCVDCHRAEAFDWAAEGINHDFFPLTEGHDITDCASCHTTPDYSKISSECITCHEADYLATTNPNHQTASISTSCTDCHTTRPGWSPAEFLQHDAQHFPIYSGSHNGEWDNCAECHTNPDNYSVFTCVTCHQNPETDEEHDEVFGYSYSSTACLACHPNGESEGAFDHNNTNFPLTGAHTTVECLSCHANGFTGTPTACAACHTMDFDGTVNPNHNALGLSTDCVSCHTTAPDWNPATFDVHDQYYVLSGAHAIIANQCAMCHQGDYTNTPTTCVGCHLQDYNQTTNPSHTALQFSTDCATCHSENAWSPSTFEHDAQYFPIYSGDHEGQWSDCIDCHTTPGNYMVYTCVTCHSEPETGEQHTGVSGYIHSSPACLACHPTGDADMAFDHNTTAFPLTGAHTTVACLDCHATGFEGTPTECASCHTQDFNQTVNPNHQSLGLSTECASCHTTDPGWSPASFAVHNEYYVLAGAHAAISNQCASCHNGDYTNTPNTCAGCHQADFNQTTDPPHVSLQFSMECAECHNESAWEPSTFDHDGQHFPIYSGSHAGQWNECAECHTTPGNYAVFTCTTCHTIDETEEDHSGVNGFVHNSAACLACHPNGEGDSNFDHNATAFPLTGAHTVVNCLECHANGFAGTPTDCQSCHTTDFQQAVNPNHTALGISTDCASCHTTEPGWSPASFAVHNEYYVLAGAHASIANQCASCHNGDYNNTPNTCAGCHQADYNQTVDPPHVTLQFSNECATCHTESAWEPATFDHDIQHFPIYSGSHQGQWSECVDCHTTPGNYAVFTCITCHANPETDEEHTGVNGYVYNSSACFGCHPNGEGDSGFDHNATAFPLTGAHTTVSCVECHANGYAGTPTDCNACHATDYAGSINPNHQQLGLPVDCASCHTTVPDWNPASFAIHNQYYVLEGAHAAIANQCATCHNGDYNNTPNTCAGCHLTDYNATTNPSHSALGLSQDCATCHTQTDWSTTNFPNHNDFYPLNGAHATIANQCALCHNGDYNNTPNTCAGCHLDNYNATTNPSHTALGYSTECASCHNETAWQPATFDHNLTNFPLTGSHTTVNCIECHANGYSGTPTACNACHQTDYNESVNPDHQSLNLSTDCISCHTTSPDWNPASFAVHNDYYVLAGAHAAIANQCATCHNGNYNNTPSTCVGCHQADYNQTNNPSHQALGFSTNCASCHTESAWSPASYNEHDNEYFPIYTGAHAGQWDACSECHTNANNYAIYTCVGCHTNPQTNQQHAGVNGYVFENSACLACHPTGAAAGAFNHDDSAFPLTGAHVTVSCVECHASGYTGTPTNCDACHLPDFNQASNPNHVSLGLSTNCITCHTTAPDWNPALFPNHNSFYPLVGAHASIANQCATCHNGNYNTTPNTCFGCHQTEYNQTNDPDHQAAQFPTDCTTCHSQNAWVPSTWDHDNLYFPIYSGRHEDEWNQCTDCHTNPNNYSIFTCITCHQQGEMAEEHDEVNGYQYNSNACLACHPDGED